MDTAIKDQHKLRRVGRPKKVSPHQDLAERIWAGQSVTLLHKDRVELLKNGLAQHGIKLTDIRIPNA